MSTTLPETIIKRNKAELGKITKNVELINNLPPPLNKIPESQFVVLILPHIRNWYRNIPDENVGVWFNLAGSPHRQLIVTDDDTGEEVYRAPSAAVPTNPVVLRRQGDSIPTNLNSLLTRQDVAILNNDSRVVAEIDKGVVDMHTFDKDPHAVLENIKLLVAIYQLYELPLDELFGDEVESIMARLEGRDDATEPKAVSGEPVQENVDDMDQSGYVY